MPHSPCVKIICLARTTHRNVGRSFGIRDRDRLSHLYTIGKTGTGKSTLLKTLIAQDFAAGNGLALFDPHGDLVEELLGLVPSSRQADLIYLNVPDSSQAFFFNALRDVPAGQEALAVAGLVEVFKKLWPDDWGPRLEHLLRNVLFTLVETPGAHLGLIPRLLSDRDWRRDVVKKIRNEEVRSFWQTEFERYSQPFGQSSRHPSSTKSGRSSPTLASRRSSLESGRRLTCGR